MIELTVTTSTLKDYDATGFLPKIKVPALYTVGEFDAATRTSSATSRSLPRALSWW
jgi:pimeloyl-ACP methyl ester carboxylesterase